jgi:hypothetical protein
VTGVLSGVLSFLPIDERLHAGQVSQHWRQELMDPSLWREQGWHLTRHIDKADALPLPHWLRERLSVVRCLVEWLLCAAPFTGFQQLRDIRHLDLLLTKTKIDMDATGEAALRRHLSSLALQSLRLPLVNHMVARPEELERYQRLLTVLLQPEPNSHAPSPLTLWLASLAYLRCEVELVPDDPMLKALIAQPWPKLRTLNLTLDCALGEHLTALLPLLHGALLPASMPALTSLALDMHCYQALFCQSCVCAGWWKALLPGMRTLTALKLDLADKGQNRLLELLHLIGVDAMPQLTQLELAGHQFSLPSDEESAAIALLQRMPLTQLSLNVVYSGGFRLQHHLPHLSVCKLAHSSYTESIVVAPNLTDLTCSAGQLSSFADGWWRRCGCPPLQHAGFVGEQEWQRHLSERARFPFKTAVANSPPPVIRALRCGSDIGTEGKFPLSASTFPYLAHLPQLRELECRICQRDLRVFGLLPQLEKLHVWLYDEHSFSVNAAPWNNEAVQQRREGVGGGEEGGCRAREGAVQHTQRRCRAPSPVCVYVIGSTSPRSTMTPRNGVGGVAGGLESRRATGCFHIGFVGGL